MNSPSTNVAVMYTNENSKGRDVRPLQPKPSTSTNGLPSLKTPLSSDAVKFEPPQASTSPFLAFDSSAMPPPPLGTTINSAPAPDSSLVSDADLLLNLHSPYSSSSPTTSRHHIQPGTFSRNAISIPTNTNIPSQHQPQSSQTTFSPEFTTYPAPTSQMFSDMVIDSQDVDMSVLGADMMPWDLEYLPHDVLYLGDSAFNLDLPDDTGGGAPEG